MIPFWENHLTIGVGGFNSGFFTWFHWSVCLPLYKFSTVLITIVLHCLQLRGMCLPTLFLFFKIILAILGSFTVIIKIIFIMIKITICLFLNFIYFCVYWVFVAMNRLSLVVACRHPLVVASPCGAWVLGCAGLIAATHS